MGSKPTTFDECLASARPDQRAVLEKLRKVIRGLVPEAEEGVSYGLAAFRINGKPLAALSAAANHCSYFPMSGKIVESLKKELQNYETSKGTIRFPANQPLPAALVRKLVRARLAEIGKTAEPKHKTMPPNGKRHQRQPGTSTRMDPAVTEFLAELDHPLKKEIERIRQVILDVSPTISEGIKWNAPSFRTSEYFATFNLRSRDRVQLIFHYGAKVKDNSTAARAISDPAGLIRWLSTNRALVTLRDRARLNSDAKALAAIVKEWIS
jgi:uncharacterized protein YdhG (YjbR/CyaY superfamily)